MRRLIAALSFLALANLVFAQGGSACPLAGSAHREMAAAASAGDHAAHHMGAGMNHDMAQPVSDDGPSQPPTCLTMGPCAVTLDIAGLVESASIPAGAVAVVAVSDRVPRSAGTTPELPPPRA